MMARSMASQAHQELVRIIRGVRTRYRLRVLAWGLVGVLAIAVAALLVAAFGMEQFRFSERAVTSFRVLAYLALFAAAVWLLLRPLLRRVSDEQVALYVEEHDPGLEASLLSAVSQLTTPADDRSRSPALVRRLVERAVERARIHEHGAGLERGSVRRAAAVAAAVAAVTIAVFFRGPDFVRYASRLVLVPWRTADAATPYRIDVEPGSVTIPRGGAQRIAANLQGFATPLAELVVRRDTVAWERIPMEMAADSSAFAVRLFDIEVATDYYVEASGVRSPIYRLTVADLPSVARIDLDYRFPAYTGLAPELVEDGGDIAAVRGTAVRVRVRATMPVDSGRLVLDGEPPIRLAADSDSALSGTITVSRPGFYRIELAGVDGAMHPASLDYVIDVLEDRAPTVRFVTPGRDTKATSIEEVFVNAEAADDFGVASLELRYSVNGAAEQRIPLHGPGGRRPREITAGHTFFLEEMNLEPGDVISYYARATDGNRVTGPTPAASDIYFIEVRPFDRTYRQAEQAGGGGGGGESPSVLSRQQREIVAATFKTVRDSATFSRSELTEHLSTLVLSQGRLRERVEELATQLHARGVMSTDSAFRLIADELPKAAAAMREAEQRLAAKDARAALPPEQRALQHLQRAEAAYREVQVSFGGDPSSGGGGESEAEDLADLFELETDKLRNQYETVQRGSQQNQQRELDELRERLRRLAERQQQENERLRRLAESSTAGGGGSGGGEAQRRMAQEAEDLARRLERLSREQSSPALQESARRLQEAAAEMRRSAASQGGGSGQGLSGASSALGRLEEARRRLEQSRSSSLESGVREALRRAESLAARQRELAADAERAAQQGGVNTAPLEERKNALASDVTELEQRLSQLSREARGRQQETARVLQEAAGFVRQRRLDEKIRFSGRVARSGSPEYVRNFEEQITADLDTLRQRISEAVTESSEGEADALDRARELVRGLEGLRERAQAQGENQGEGDGQGRGQAQEGQAQEGQGQEGQGQGQGQGQRVATPGAGTPGGGGQGGGVISPQAARQFAREYRERREGAESLRRELARLGLGVEDLDRLIARMRALESERIYDDQEELHRLQGAVLEGFKAFEFALRRRLEGADDSPLLGGAAEVPPEFRRLVEEYYRALARGGRR